MVAQNTQPDLSPCFMAELSAIAYADQSAIRQWLWERNWQLECFLDSSETECFVAVDRRRTTSVFAFRGTQPDRLSDWLTDVNSRQVNWANGRVHSGFLNSVNRVFKDLYPVLEKLAADDIRLHGTGHSKGAAEATLTAAFLRAAQIPVAGLWTFGSPRVGDAEFAAWMNAVMPFAIHRYVNNNDIVARVPLPAKWLAAWVPFGWLWPIGFRHCGKLHYIASNGEVLETPSLSRLCFDRIRGRWLAGWHGLTDGTRDHAITNYTRALS